MVQFKTEAPKGEFALQPNFATMYLLSSCVPSFFKFQFLGQLSHLRRSAAVGMFGFFLGGIFRVNFDRLYERKQNENQYGDSEFETEEIIEPSSQLIPYNPVMLGFGTLNFATLPFNPLFTIFTCFTSIGFIILYD